MTTSWRRRGKRLLVATLAATVLMPGWFLLEANHRIEDKRRALVTELPPLLATDEAEALALLSSPLFDPPSGEDAGPVLNARLAWDGGAHNPRVPEQCVRALRRAGAEWQLLTRDEVAGCEVGWLHDLRKFGRWTLHSGRQRIPARRTDLGFPEFVELQDLAKLHLLLAVDHEEAAQDVRHLARLLFTHEYLLSAMIGVALLGIEEKSRRPGSKG